MCWAVPELEVSVVSFSHGLSTFSFTRGCNVCFCVWLPQSQILTWLQLLRFLNVSQHFWENIITLNISLAHECLSLAPMNFDKAFGSFWKEGHILEEVY